MKGRVLALSLFSLVSYAVAVERPALVDETETRRAFRANVKFLLANGQFAELETLTTELRLTRACWPGGEPKMADYYSAFDSWLYGDDLNPTNRDPGVVASNISLLQQWTTAQPDSITARIGLAKAYGAYLSPAMRRHNIASAEKTWPCVESLGHDDSARTSDHPRAGGTTTMKRLLCMLLVFESVLAPVRAEFQMPRKVQRMAAFETAKAEAVEQGKPLTFVYTHEKTSCGLATRASLAAVAALDSKTVVVYVNSEDPEDWRKLPGVVQEALRAPEAGRFIPKTVVVDARLSNVRNERIR